MHVVSMSWAVAGLATGAGLVPLGDMWLRATARRMAEHGPTRAHSSAKASESNRKHVNMTQRAIAGDRMSASSLCRAAETMTAASN